MKLPARSLLTALATLVLAPSVQAEPALWKVEDTDSAIWLFGSFHILPEDAVWKTELFDAVLADADKIVFEADIRPAAAAQLGAEAFVRGVYTDGTLLTDAMDEAMEARLRELAAALELPMGSILAMRPWMATNTITVQALAGKGYGAEGVEFVLQPQLTDERLGFLETGQQQLDILAGAPEDEQIAMLAATLDELDSLPKIMEKMMRSWLAGTPEKLGDLFLMEMGGFETAFLERLIYERNRNWIAPLETMLAENSQNLVIVGAAHLIGEGSVLDLMQQAGYAVERIQ